MERHIQIFLRKVSYICIGLGTLTFLILFMQTPDTCVDRYISDPKPHHRFPKSTCDYSHRAFISREKHNKRLWATKSWAHSVNAYLTVFQSLQSRNYLFNHSKAFVNSAGAGQAVVALKDLGLTDITAVELLDYPPLVRKADPLNLPFFDGVFDFGFTAFLDRALFPGRYVGEMERTVRVGGICVVAVEACGSREVDEIAKLFKKSKYMGASNVTLAGQIRTRILFEVTS